MSALDGAISNIRLWTLGNLDHKILPNKAAINKLRDILASNVAVVQWNSFGDQSCFKESSSDVYKFLVLKNTPLYLIVFMLALAFHQLLLVWLIMVVASPITSSHLKL